jgi:hypothetical protein
MEIGHIAQVTVNLNIFSKDYIVFVSAEVCYDWLWAFAYLAGRGNRTRQRKRLTPATDVDCHVTLRFGVIHAVEG